MSKIGVSFLHPQVPYRDSIMPVLAMSGRFRPPQVRALSFFSSRGGGGGGNVVKTG